MRRITNGNEPLDAAGLVALARCGHWWVYRVSRAPADGFGGLAGLNLGVACSFCVGNLYAATRAHARPVVGRVN